VVFRRRFPLRWSSGAPSPQTLRPRLARRYPNALGSGGTAALHPLHHERVTRVAEYYSDEGSIFVRIGNLTRHSIVVDLSDVQYVDPPLSAEGQRTRIRLGDMLVSITAYLGSVAVASEPVLGAYINQHIALVRVDQTRLDPRFAAYSILGDVGRVQLTGLGYGGTKFSFPWTT